MPPIAAYRPPSIAALLGMAMLVACAHAPDLHPAGTVSETGSFREGKRHLEAGDAVQAVSAFRAQIRRNGADVGSLNGLAIAYGELGQPDLATEMFARALAIAPDDPTTLNNVGFSALRRAEPVLARHYLERARGLTDDHQEINGNLTRLALLEGFEGFESPEGLADLDGRPSEEPPARRAPPLSVERRSASHLRLAGLPARHRTVISGPVPESRISPDASATMIDFTTVLDPFSAPHKKTDNASMPSLQNASSRSFPR